MKKSVGSSSKAKTDTAKSRFHQQKRTTPKRERVRLGGLGDDGLVMTPNRMNSHRILNIYFIWGLALVVIGAIVSVLSYFQGGSFDPSTMVASGGATINGIELQTLLRFEALYALISGSIFFGTSFLGFSWLYDKQPLSTSRKWLIVNNAISLGWCVFWILTLNVPEPLSLIEFVLAALFIKFSNGVESDKAIK